MVRKHKKEPGAEKRGLKAQQMTSRLDLDEMSCGERNVLQSTSGTVRASAADTNSASSSASAPSGGVQPHRLRRLGREGSQPGPLVGTRYRVRRRESGGDPAPSLGSREHLSRRR